MREAGGSACWVRRDAVSLLQGPWTGRLRLGTRTQASPTVALSHLSHVAGAANGINGVGTEITGGGVQRRQVSMCGARRR